MKLDILKQLVNEKKTQREIANLHGVSQATVKYWLKKYKLKTLNKAGQRKGTHCCSKCLETDAGKFYGNDKRLCAKCSNQRNLEKMHFNREYVLNALGNKCVECGFDKYKCALDTHHTDPTKKDKNFGSMRNWNIERVKKEIQTCILLCKNCHVAHHNGLLTLKQ